MPQWLRSRAGKSLHDVLADPVSTALNYVRSNRVQLQDISKSLGLVETAYPCAEILRDAVSVGDSEWWRRHDMDALRDWANQRPHDGILVAVADRMLREYGVRHRSLGEISATNEGALLLQWVLSRLGHPETRSTYWAQVSAQGREVFEALYVALEFSKILGQFAQHANDDRAKYWATWSPEVKDARLIRSKETDVCLMVIRGQLVVEFGYTGNACYFYRIPIGAPRLRALSIKERAHAGDFKSKHALKFGQNVFPYYTKLSHHRGWQPNVNEQLGRKRFTMRKHW